MQLISFYSIWQVIQGKGIQEWRYFIIESNMASKNNEVVLAISVSLTCAGLITLVIIMVIFLVLQKR